MRFTRSPVGWLSRYEVGSICMRENASFRRSASIPKDTRLLSRFIIHCTTAPARAMMTIAASIFPMPSISTLPLPIARSMAWPVSMGVYSVRTTYTAESSTESASIHLYLPSLFITRLSSPCRFMTPPPRCLSGRHICPCTLRIRP